MPTIENLFMSKEISQKSHALPRDEDIAVIGLSCKIAGTNNKDEYWDLIRNNTDMITSFPEQRKKDNATYCAQKGINNEFYSYHKGGYIENISQFDFDFFGLTPKQAELMDPQQRLFLESAWMAIEDAGYSKQEIRGTNTGIYLGLSTDFGESYKNMLLTLQKHLEGLELTGNINSIIASRISHLLDFKGPSVVIDTACSSSLSALHYACMALKNNDCEMAIVGSVKIDLLPLVNKKEVLDELGITSVRNSAVIFGEKSNGTSLGEGVGAILLKPLNAARRDCDNIYAIIKGTAINNDGNSAGITAPNPQAQRDVLISAWENAGISPETLSYIEAHGTGTALGDPIEIAGIQLAFSRYTDKKQFCAIGSVKGNIGHLDHAAGMASLIKVILMLQHRMLTPIHNFYNPNPNIDFFNTPVYVNDRCRTYDLDTPMRCGVSAFGLSGTNCHAVLEEFRNTPPKSGNNGPYIIKASAKSKASLYDFLKSILGFLKKNPRISLEDMSFTLNTGRDDYNFRTAIVFQDYTSLLCKLEENITIFHCANCSNIQKKQLALLLDRLDETTVKEEKNMLLQELAEIYVAGGNIQWDYVYKHHYYRRISVPGYQFQKSRCWFSALPDQEKTCKNDFYGLAWKKADNCVATGAQSAQRFLIFINDNTIDINKVINMTSNDAVIVTRGDQYIKLSQKRYQVQSLEDYKLLFHDMRSEKINHIISVYSCQTCDIEEALDKGLYSLHRIIKDAFLSGIRLDFRLSVITYNSLAVLPYDNVLPFNSCMEGFIKCIMLECPNIRAKLIDIDNITNCRSVKKELEADNRYSVVAYRNDVRYLRTFLPVTVEPLKEDLHPVRPGGIYLLTGGYGDLGLEIAKAMAKQTLVHFILTGRKGFPPRSEWDKLALEGGPIGNKIKILLDIESSGSTVEILQADVADQNQMQNIFDYISKNYGKLNGIVHMAGNPGHGVAMLKSLDDVKNVVKPKILGTMILDSYVTKNKLDFFILFSSVTSVVPEAGQTDYASANSFLNSYAQQKINFETPVMSICWPAWTQTGMAVHHNVDFEKELFVPLSTKKAIAAFFMLLTKKASVIIPSFINDYKIDKEQRIFDVDFISTETDNGIHVDEDENKSSTEYRLRTIWKEILGLEEFDHAESFHSLGGDSIMAIHMLKRINTDFNLTLDITDLFAFPSLDKLTQFIDSLT